MSAAIPVKRRSARFTVVMISSVIAAIAVITVAWWSVVAPRLPVAPTGVNDLILHRVGDDALGVASNGCITVGNAFLIAPHGSSQSFDRTTLNLSGVGSYRIGDHLPTLGGETFTVPEGDTRPSALQPCGAGRYVYVKGKYTLAPPS